MTPLVFLGEFGGETPSEIFNNDLNLLRAVDTDVYGLMTLNATGPESRDSAALRTRTVEQYIRNQTNAFWGAGKDQVQVPINQMFDSLSPNRFHQRTSAMGEKAQSTDSTDPNAAPAHILDFVDWNDGRTAGWPSTYKFPYLKNSELQDIDLRTLSSGFHEAFFIDEEGKLKSGTTKNYGGAGVGESGLSVFFDYFTHEEYYENFADLTTDQKNKVGGESGPDRRVGEMFINADMTTPGSSLEQFYDAGVTLTSVSVASDNALATLDANGSVRVIGGQDIKAFPTEGVRGVIYFDKDDVADGFFTDETGTPQLITNEGFVQVTASGGGNNQGTPVTIWALHKSGKLYGADWASSITFDSEENRWTRIPAWTNPEKTQINPIWMKKQTRVGSGNVISCMRGSDGLNPRNFNMFCATTNGTDARDNGLALAIANNIRRIPVNPNTNERFPVVNMQPTYGAGGVVTAIDTTYTAPSNASVGIFDDRPLYKVDIIPICPPFDETNAANIYPAAFIQQFFDRHFRYWKSEKSSTDGSILTDWTYSENENVDNEVMDLLFKENSRGVTYHVPPINVVHNRQGIWAQTGHSGGDSGYLVCFQGRSRTTAESDSNGFNVGPFYPVTYIGNNKFGHTGAGRYTGTTGDGYYWGLNFGSGTNALVTSSGPLPGGSVTAVQWTKANTNLFQSLSGATGSTASREVGQGFGNPLNKVDIPRNFVNYQTDPESNDYYTVFNLYDSYPEYEYNWFHNDNIHHMTKGYTAASNSSEPGDSDYDWGGAMVQIFAACGANKTYPQSREVKTGNFFYDPIVEISGGGDGISIQTKSGRIDSASYRILTNDALVVHPAWEPVVGRYEYDIGDLYGNGLEYNLPTGACGGIRPNPGGEIPDGQYAGPATLLPQLHHNYYNDLGP